MLSRMNIGKASKTEHTHSNCWSNNTVEESNWTPALSSRAFQVRKIDRINTYLAMYGTVWRLKIISHQHDTTIAVKNIDK